MTQTANDNERHDYEVTVHLPGTRLAIANGMTASEASETMRRIGLAYKASGLNPVEAQYDYMTFTAPTGEMIGVWAHPRGTITDTVIERQRRRWLARSVAVTAIKATSDYTVDADRTPSEILDSVRDGSEDVIEVAQNG